MSLDNQTKPVVSVIIPTFNRVNILYPTLICLVNQKTGINYEIIIIDSGNDETGPLVAKFQKSYPGIKYKKIQSYKNRALLRNKGVVLASGDILLFLDNDMLVPPEFIETHYKAHVDSKKLILLGKRMSLVEYNSEKIGYNVLFNYFPLLDTLPYYRDVRDQELDDRGRTLDDVGHHWRFCYSHNFSVRTELFFKSGKFNTRFGEHWGYEDIELGYQMDRIGGVFRMEDALKVYHQTHFEQSRVEQGGAV